MCQTSQVADTATELSRHGACSASVPFRYTAGHTHTHTHTHRFNGHLPGEPGLAGCPLNVPFSFSLRLQDRPRACCRNVRLANRRLTLTARLTRCRVGRSSVSLAISLTVCPVLTNLLTLKHSAWLAAAVTWLLCRQEVCLHGHPEARARGSFDPPPGRLKHSSVTASN